MWETTEFYKQQQWDTHFHMVLKFLCGIRKFSGYLSEVLSMSCVTSDDIAMIFNDDVQDHNVPGPILKLAVTVHLMLKLVVTLTVNLTVKLKVT